MKPGDKLLLAVCALVLTVLAIPSVAGAESCPIGQTGTPPYCTTPANKFTLETVKREGASARIRVKVPGPGAITASGKDLLTTKATAKSAGKFWLPLKLGKAGVAALRKERTLKVKVTFVYTPTGGSPARKRKTVRFNLK
jgi:hypothetical protein